MSMERNKERRVCNRPGGRGDDGKRRGDVGGGVEEAWRKRTEVEC
jgi:hypothetical protein